MAKKDTGLQEETSHQGKASEPADPKPETPPTTYVKNAHASGDGSFGRNDTPIDEPAKED